MNAAQIYVCSVVDFEPQKRVITPQPFYTNALIK